MQAAKRPKKTFQRYRQKTRIGCRRGQKKQVLNEEVIVLQLNVAGTSKLKINNRSTARSWVVSIRELLAANIVATSPMWLFKFKCTLIQIK